MARYKGSLEPFVRGAAALRSVTSESHVLISEGCTHHRQCEDIGTVKIPRLLKRHAGAEPEFSFTSGAGFPDSLEGIDLVIHCGACMLNDREVAHRVSQAQSAGIPIVNYGMALAAMNGMLARTLEPFPEVAEMLGN
jgi:predicted GTPase